MSDLKQSDNSNPLAQITSKICVLSGSTIMLLALALIAAWASGRDKGIGYLGGLNWNDKVHLYFLRAIFNWHPVLMTAGVACCAGLGISSYRGLNSSTQISLPSETWKVVSKVIHTGFMLGTLVFMSVGLSAVWKSKNQTGKPNLSTLHSWIGVITIILIGQNYIFGAGSFLIKIFSEQISAAYAPIHRVLGALALIVGVMAICSGIQFMTYGCQDYNIQGKDTNPAEYYKDMRTGCKLANGAGVAVIIGLILILFGISDLKHDPINSSVVSGPGPMSPEVPQLMSDRRGENDDNAAL